jgi:copper(I)-binding protein
MKTIRSVLDMKKLGITVLIWTLFLVACSPAAPQSKIEVSQASVRLLGGDMPAAGYMLIKNNSSTNDRLLGVKADFAGQPMLHQSSVDANGVASMKMVMSIDVPAGGQVEFKPGGFHIEFDNLTSGLKAGDVVTILLQFEQAGTISAQAQVTNQ